MKYYVKKGIRGEGRAYTGPEHVVIDITNRCANSCIACWTRSSLLRKNGPMSGWHNEELSLHRSTKLIEELHQLGTQKIRFTGGGDPLMHHGILKLIEKVKSHRMYCALTTSLYGIDPDSINSLLTSGLDELSVSLWASNAEEYKKTHPNQTAEAFEKITRTLYAIKDYKKSKMWRYNSIWRSAGPRVNILNVICNLNCQNVEKMFDYAVLVGANSIYFTVVDTIEGSTDVLLLSEEQRNIVRQACMRIRNKNNRLNRKQRVILDGMDLFESRLQQNTAQNGYYDYNDIDETPCYIGWIFCRIMANGQVAPCCRGVHRTMGNVNELSFEEIWYSDKYNVFRRYAKSKSKHHVYFREFNCHKTCDNRAHNIDVHKWIS